MALKKTTLVPRPEDDPVFRKLVEERQKLLEQREKDGKEWAHCRARLDELGGQQSVMDPSSPAWREIRKEQLQLHARTGEIEEASRSAKARIREIQHELPHARSRAAAKIASETAPQFNGAVAEYLRARLQENAAALTAAATVFPMRDALELRRVGLRGMYVPADLTARQTELARLREDVLQGLAMKLLTKRDVPDGLAAAWGIT